MKKEFVPYEQALELKKLGFNDECFVGYDIYTKELYIGYENSQRTFNIEYYILAPTYSQVFRWFREKCKLRFSIIDDHSDNDKPYSFTTEHEYYYDTGSGNDWFRTHEEAEIECLKKLIEIVKQK